MAGPKNASVNAGGFRIYQWAGGDNEVNRRYGAVEPVDLLSVTSIKSLAGEHYRLVNWKIANVVNLAMGVRKAVRIGPRGGVNEVYVPDGDAPGEFVKRMLEVKSDKARDELRSWLRSTADEPRDIAAVRGSVVHKMIEMGLTMAVIDRDLIEKRMTIQWSEEKRRVKPAFTDDDFNFVSNGMGNYWHMRGQVPFVILAQEPQVFNLKAGYAGSLDVLLWFLGYWSRAEPTEEYPQGEVTFVPLPEFDQATEAGRKNLIALQKEATTGKVTVDDVDRIGGQVGVGDWKTSKGVYTSHVIQTTAYLGAEFVAEDGVIDTRLSDLLGAASLGVVIHIRPDKWAVDLFEWRKDIFRAFLGSVAYARFLAFYQEPDALFVYTLSGRAEGVEGSQYADDSE